MRINLHTHTPRCRHAVGTEREYIEAALEAGMEILGFSDHAPMCFPGDYYSIMRMYPEETAGYFETLLTLREEYRGKIQILIGMEIEYYPDLFRPTLEFLSQFPLEYLILGQHYLYGEEGDPGSSVPTEDPERLRQYVDQCCEALETGKFTYFAHPELIRFTGEKDLYIAEMERLCRKAKETETPLELNMLGYGAKRHYPDPCFWAIAGRIGNTAVIGVDAHKPQALLAKQAEDYCRDLADSCGITLLETAPLRCPF